MLRSGNQEILQNILKDCDSLKEDVSSYKIAKCIINGDNENLETTLDLNPLSTESFIGDQSLFEIAVRANNLDALKILCEKCEDLDFDIDDVDKLLEVRPLFLAIKLGFNEIAMHLFEREYYNSYAHNIFPGDLSRLDALSEARYSENKELINYFVKLIKRYHNL